MKRHLRRAFAVCVLAATAAYAAGAKNFSSPEEAVQALVAAARAGDTRAMLAVLGPEAKQIVSSGDAAVDKQARERFVASYGEANKISRPEDGMALLLVGKDEWIMPIPIVKDAAGWHFDAAEGKEEILNRRIGRNELHAIEAVQAYVDAQREYYLRNPQHDKLLQYAQKFVSAKGKRDGLYFPVKSGEPQSPLGPRFDRMPVGNGEPGKRVPYHGYYYRILKGQGPDAPGGAYDYLVGDKLMGGFAVIAWPANYGVSGITSFLVNHDGVVYEKDLGKQTGSIASATTRFNPDATWRKAQ